MSSPVCRFLNLIFPSRLMRSRRSPDAETMKDAARMVRRPISEASHAQASATMRHEASAMEFRHEVKGGAEMLKDIVKAMGGRA